MRASLLGGMLIYAVLGPWGSAAAQEGEDSEARVHFRLGRAYYDSGRFDDAAREFQQAYDMSQRPALLYNIFVAHRDAGALGPAVHALREYLRLVPDAEDREQLTARLATMERLHQSQSADAPPSEPAAPAPRPDEPAPVVTHAALHVSVATHSAGGGGTWTPGWIIAGTGGAAAVVGILTGVLALDAQSTLGRMCDASGACNPGFEGTRDSAGLLAGLTDAFLIGGLAVAATGVVLALIVPSGGSDRPQAGLFCGSTGCAATLRASF